MKRYLTFVTLDEAIKAAADHDVILYGQGSDAEPYLLCDAGTAIDLLSDDIGRQAAQALLRKFWILA